MVITQSTEFHWDLYYGHVLGSFLDSNQLAHGSCSMGVENGTLETEVQLMFYNRKRCALVFPLRYNRAYRCHLILFSSCACRHLVCGDRCFVCSLLRNIFWTAYSHRSARSVFGSPLFYHLFNLLFLLPVKICHRNTHTCFVQVLHFVWYFYLFIDTAVPDPINQNNLNILACIIWAVTLKFYLPLNQNWIGIFSLVVGVSNLYRIIYDSRPILCRANNIKTVL